MTYKVNHKELNEMLKEYYKKKLALFVFGTFGIGKSFVVRDTAKEIAKERKRTFIEWNKITREEKDKVYNNPKDYFVLVDIRLSEFDSTDIKGLPNFNKNNDEIIDWRIPYWAKFLTLKDSDGILFFDEVNLAPPLVISSVYKIIYDRVVDDSKIYDNWLIVGAGNLDSDRAFTHTLPAPVRDRGGEAELVVSTIDDWTEWAIQNDVDSRIVGFANFKPSILHNVDYNNNQKFTTTRGLERLSNLIKDLKVESKTFELMCCSSIGEGIAKEFIAFCKIKDKMDLDKIIKNPKLIEKITDISVKYFLVSAITEKYKNNKLNFNDIMGISEVLDKINNPEFVALLWKMCSVYTSKNNKFKKEFCDYKGNDDLINKYSNYLLG